MVRIDVNGTHAAVRSCDTLTVGQVGEAVEFRFDEAWDGLTKTAVFRQLNITKDQAGIENTTQLPPEVLHTAGMPVEIGVYGANEDGTKVIPTVWVKTKAVEPGADPSGDASVNPTLPVWEQVLQKAEKAEAAAEKAVTETAQIQKNKESVEKLQEDKLDASELPKAVDDALAQAKESGEFNGKDYVLTDADKDEIAEMAADLVEIPDSGGNVDHTIETVLSLKEVQVGSHKSGAFDSADNKSICTRGYVKPFVVSAKVVSVDYRLAVVVYHNGAYVRTDSWITVDNTYTFDHENYQYKLYIKRSDNDYIWDFDGCRKSTILTISTEDILESYNALEADSETERRNTRNAVQYMMRRNYDISYANAPAPLDLITYAGSNQIVHPKVLYFPNKFGRHKFWLAYNPYPLANAYYENPCVAYSDDGYEWTNIPGNPLDDPGEYGINTDVHLVYVETKNRLEIWWRYADNKDDTVEVRREIIYRRTSTDGLNWTERETVFVNDSGDTVQNLSPCILHDGSKYKVWVVNDTESTVKYYEGMEERNATADETIALNDADLNPGAYLVNGNIQESENYKHTDKIKLSASKTFLLTGKNSNGVPYHIPIRYIVAFDADGNRLSDYSRNTETVGGTISSMPTRQIVMNEAVDSVVLTLYRPEQYTEKVITLEGVDGGTSELSFVRDIPLTFPDDGTGHRLWHIDVIEDNGKTVMLPMCRARDSSVAIEQTWSLFLCTSEDNVTYTKPVQTIIGNPYGWDKQIYRGSIVNVDGEYRIYYTAQDERQRHGLGISTSNTLSNFVGKW